MSKHKQQAAPEFSTNAEGHRLAHIALTGTDRRATLYAEDYERLMACGFSRWWQCTSDQCGNVYPTLGAYTERGQSRVVTVARLLAAADAGKRVRYADGNPLNLRTENLRLEDAPVRRSAAHWYPNVAALREAGITPAKRERHRKDQEATGMPIRTSERSAKRRTRRSTPSCASSLPLTPRAPYAPPVRDVRAISARLRQTIEANKENGAHA